MTLMLNTNTMMYKKSKLKVVNSLIVTRVDDHDCVLRATKSSALLDFSSNHIMFTAKAYFRALKKGQNPLELFDTIHKCEPSKVMFNVGHKFIQIDLDSFAIFPLELLTEEQKKVLQDYHSKNSL